MSNHHRLIVSLRFADWIIALGALVMVALPLCASTPIFGVPDDVPLGIRLDDTLTSTDSEVNDPFSATEVEQGDYQGARVYGHVAEIVDLFDAKSKSLHWRGLATDTLSDSSDTNIKKLNTSVHQLFDHFPPQAKN